MDRLTARRKLLRGSLSAPLVLTVVSPAALARQSFEACLNRAQDEQADPPTFIGADEHDTWLRSKTEIFRGTLIGEGQPERDFYRDSGPNNYYPVDVCGEVYHFADFRPDGRPTSIGFQLALVYVDSSGNIVGFGPCSQGGFPVSTSCWASFQAGRVG